MLKKVGEPDAIEVTKESQPKASSKPKKTKKQSTPSDLKPSEVESLVVELGNQDFSGSEIGVQLRDQHNVLSVHAHTGKTIGDILSAHGLSAEIPEDLMALIRRVVALNRHLAQNRKDFSAKRGFQLTVSKIRRLVAYYHEKKKLPADWRYSIEKARLLVK